MNYHARPQEGHRGVSHGGKLSVWWGLTAHSAGMIGNIT